ncbi:MAG TPA: hypothetical protein VG737_00265, partial [Cyclobacteriaceae bacterium]|nr:hypothetical protein [Cyclobacteriaceae bacterium]
MTQTRKLYLLSGLGADKTALDFIDLSGYKCTHLEWIQPVKNESIESYAKRLSKPIDTIRPILIGVSFGGMMAIEISR